MAARSTAMAIVSVAVLATAAAAHAQPAGPGYYRVSVDDDDVLNVRAEPGAAHPRVAALAPGASPIEVVDVRTVQGTPWGLVAAGEGAGWVSMRYLDPIEPDGVAGTTFPAAATCTGTEPFFSLTFEDETAVFSRPDDPAGMRLPIDTAAPASGRFHPILMSFADDRGHAVLDRRVCSDGMSDIPHGWSLSLILTREPGQAPDFLSGCCRVRTAPPRPE